jgi:hypothetical protein
LEEGCGVFGGHRQIAGFGAGVIEVLIGEQLRGPRPSLAYDMGPARVECRMTTEQPRTLSHKEFRRFVAALDEAPAAVPELVTLFSQASQLPQA